MAVINQLSGFSTSNGLDISVKNYTGSDIPAGTAVKLDTGNPMGTNLPPGVVTTSSDANFFGIALTVIPAGKNGQVRVGGGAVAIAGASTSVGDYLMSNASGQVVTSTAGKYVCGIGVSAGTTSGDQILVLVVQSKNA